MIGDGGTGDTYLAEGRSLSPVRTRESKVVPVVQQRPLLSFPLAWWFFRNVHMVATPVWRS